MHALARSSRHVITIPLARQGLHRHGDTYSIRLYEPRANSAWLHDGSTWVEMREEAAGLFAWTGRSAPRKPYRVQLRIGTELITRHDAYAFRPAIPQEELYLFKIRHRGDGRIAIILQPQSVAESP